MADLTNYLAVIFGMIFVDIGAFYVAWRKMKSTERTDGTQMLKDLQEIADRAVGSQKEAVEELRMQKEAFEKLSQERDAAQGARDADTNRRIVDLERQIQLLLNGEMRIELLIGGNPRRVKTSVVENVMG